MWLSQGSRKNLQKFMWSTNERSNTLLFLLCSYYFLCEMFDRYKSIIHSNIQTSINILSWTILLEMGNNLFKSLYSLLNLEKLAYWQLNYYLGYLWKLIIHRVYVMSLEKNINWTYFETMYILGTLHIFQVYAHIYFFLWCSSMFLW